MQALQLGFAKQVYCRLKWQTLVLCNDIELGEIFHETNEQWRIVVAYLQRAPAWCCLLMLVHSPHVILRSCTTFDMCMATVTAMPDYETQSWFNHLKDKVWWFRNTCMSPAIHWLQKSCTITDHRVSHHTLEGRVGGPRGRTQALTYTWPKME